MAAYLIVSGVLQIGAIAIDVARGRVASGDLLQGKLTLTPTLLLSVNLTNALSIPIAMLLQWGFFGQRPRWIHSVVGRFRWRVVGRGALIVLPVWALYVALSALVAPDAPAAGLSGESILMLVIVVLTTPLQAAGEEYGARGLITRAAGSWVSGPTAPLVVGTLVSSTIFMLAHGAGDPWLIVFYFLFGVGLSLVTWRTGGLEVAIVIHTVNNMVAFGIAHLVRAGSEQRLGPQRRHRRSGRAGADGHADRHRRRRLVLGRSQQGGAHLPAGGPCAAGGASASHDLLQLRQRPGRAALV